MSVDSFLELAYFFCQLRVVTFPPLKHGLQLACGLNYILYRPVINNGRFGPIREGQFVQVDSKRLYGKLQELANAAHGLLTTESAKHYGARFRAGHGVLFFSLAKRLPTCETHILEEPS